MYDLAAVSVFVAVFALLFVVLWGLARLWVLLTPSDWRSPWQSWCTSSTRCSAESAS